MAYERTYDLSDLANRIRANGAESEGVIDALEYERDQIHSIATEALSAIDRILALLESE